MYAGPLEKAMKKAFPGRGERALGIVLEDNDPAGYKSNLATKTKEECRIQTLDLPPRSPDFNVLDYSLWHAINEKMRDQEANFPADKKETAEEFKQRLRRTALTLPASVVMSAVQDMKRRLGLLHEARGKLINEWCQALA